MADKEKMAELKELSRKLNQLVKDPQPGLGTWNGFIGEVLQDLAFWPSKRGSAKVESLYAVEVKGKGYYTHEQPNPRMPYTKNLQKAALYDLVSTAIQTQAAKVDTATAIALQDFKDGRKTVYHKVYEDGKKGIHGVFHRKDAR